MEIEDNNKNSYDIHPDFEYDVEKYIDRGEHDRVDALLKSAPVATGAKQSVSKLYEQKTGKPWSTAKEEGLTDSSYESNMKLRKMLLDGSLKSSKSNPIKQEQKQEQNPIKQEEQQDYSKATNFNQAFKIARKQLGANKIFEWQGKNYGTNVAGEEFKPEEEELVKFNMNNDAVKQNLAKQNKMVKSPYSSKEVTKLEKGYKNWESIKKRNSEINKMEDVDKIISYQSDKDEQYMIVDKKSSRMHLYKGGKLLDSFEVGTGANPGDAQTVTKVMNGKVDWDAGNKSTGAGIYTISNVDPSSEHYYGLPSYNMVNENGIEVSTTIHGTPYARRSKFDNDNVEDNRMSNGCINGKCTDLNKLYKDYKVGKGTKIYILPEDEGNQMVYQDGKVIMKASAKNRDKYLEYTDKKGVVQKGQGVNESRNTLSYKPIKMYINKTEFENDVFTAGDFNDTEEYEKTTKPFITSLKDNKKKVMQAAKIPSDVYNEIAKISFGVYGTESNFGDTHSAVGNLARAVTKYYDPKGTSSPDYKSKESTYGADKENQSVGLTQIRFSYLNEDEKKALKEVGITSNQDFMEPTKAAMGTAIVLGVRYNQQLTPSQKKDLWKHLPTKWNRRGNYADRVKSNSKYLSIKQEE
jgi:hypothetical protein